MNWVDIAILVVWGVTILWGYSTGLMGVLVPLISLVIGVSLSSRIGDSIGGMFSIVTDNGNAQAVAGFILVFGVLFVAGGILNFMARKILGVIPLFGFVNSLAGMGGGCTDWILTAFRRADGSAKISRQRPGGGY